MWRSVNLFPDDGCHERAEQACVKLTRQLGYAQELTEQLADYRSPEPTP
ncbi:hypothetical protein [Mycobacterium sp. C31M]